METEVAKCFVERKTFEIKEKELLVENDRLLELIISQDLVHTAMNTLAAIANYQKMDQSYVDEYNEYLELKTELSKKNDMVEKALKAKDNSISKLKDHIATLKGKSVFEGDKSENISKVIALRMYKLDLEPLSPKILKNREAHVDYLKHIRENDDTLCEIVEQAIALRPLDSDFDSALISSTSASGSKPPGNTKKNRISRPTSSNKKNIVEDHISKKKKIWKPTGKAFTNVAYRWIPTGRTFTIDGNKCPLTRITSTTVVSPKKPLLTTVVKETPSSSNNSGKLKDITNIGRSTRPLVPRLGLLQAHDRAALSAHQIC
ncbi:hypothetical protein Tco_0178943 [Tanacetum coccineum]